MARGAAQRGKRIAFGDGSNIIWDQHSEQIFRGNPNIAKLGSEHDSDLEWIHHYKGHRLYNSQDHKRDRWIWNYDFRAQPGEIFFTNEEMNFANKVGKDFILIEPHVPEYKVGVINKKWPLQRYANVVEMLKRRGFNVQQFRNGGGAALPGVGTIQALSFRHALAVLSQAALYIGPEGGLHHGAAAVGTPAVVVFGAWIPPQVTGYQTHINLTGGAQEFCGKLQPCHHCILAMEAIKSKHVYSAAKEILECRSTSLRGFMDRSGLQSTLNDCSQVSGAI